MILDNLSTHKPKRDMWLRRHPNIHFHYTPTHGSWLCSRFRLDQERGPSETPQTVFRGPVILGTRSDLAVKTDPTFLGQLLDRPLMVHQKGRPYWGQPQQAPNLRGPRLKASRSQQNLNLPLHHVLKRNVKTG